MMELLPDDMHTAQI